jgi:single-stranded-DNA-specific exonuclease
MVEKRWIIRKHDRQAVAALAVQINVQPLTAALLISRGYSTPESAYAFLNPSFEQLHDPFLLKGMREAVDRILSAAEKREKVLIWGDYDVDGTTGTVVLRKVFKLLGIESEYHIPNRFTEGYGINIPALEDAQVRGCTLGISVDCGIRSFEPMEWARDNGLDLIITDHHLPDEDRGNPPALAVLNPNQQGCDYPDKHLAGVGVAFKLAHALLRETGREDLVPALLKISAIGTVADVVSLTGENRVIVSLGLADILSTKNYGLKALMEVSDCTSEMTSTHIGFRIAPRINAAGRMDIARHVVELFEANDFNDARKLAELLNTRNRERQQMQQKIADLALLDATEYLDKHFVVVSGEGWHRGVIGLAASRIAERMHRPTIVLSTENGIAYGSARSIAGFHLLEAMNSCADLFEQFGGHAAAAGMTMNSENISAIRQSLNDHALAVLTSEDLLPAIHIDAPVSSTTLGLDLLQELARLEPFGAGNPKPVFITRNLLLRDDPFVMKEKHLKFQLVDDTGKRFEAVWWDGVERSKGRTPHMGSRIEVAYCIEANTWQGNTRLQLVVQDLREHN